MVVCLAAVPGQQCCLSVLALSSRFDGRILSGSQMKRESLSVLALSSRFDGRRNDCDVY